MGYYSDIMCGDPQASVLSSLFSVLTFATFFFGISIFLLLAMGIITHRNIDGPIGDLVKIKLEIFLHKSFQVVQRKSHDI